jgi:NitT/TauT family transport system substrate-binding protein
MAENLAALRRGQIDAAQLFEPFVEETLGTGAGYLWHAASSRGRTTYTAFVTTRDRLLRDPEPFLRMTRAIFRTQQWLKNKPADQIAATIASFFPAIDPGALARALARCRAQRVWGDDPVLPEDGFDRLRRGLVSSGFIRRPIAFQACVDNRLALQAVAG